MLSGDVIVNAAIKAAKHKVSKGLWQIHGASFERKHVESHCGITQRLDVPRGHERDGLKMPVPSSRALQICE